MLFLCYLLIFCGASSDINIFMFSHMERGREKGARENGGGGREGEGRKGTEEKKGRGGVRWKEREGEGERFSLTDPWILLVSLLSLIRL